MWAEAKEVFFTIGSFAGVAALTRAFYEDKLQRDRIRIQHVKDLVSEQDLLNLEYTVWYARSAQDTIFRKLRDIEYELEKQHDDLRFSGPTAKYLLSAVRDIAEHLENVAAKAHEITLAYQRFQIVSDLHIFEVPFAKLLLAKRIRAHGGSK